MQALKTVAMEEIHRIVKNRHEVAQNWKAKTGGKVLGYFNPDIPEELVYAAGVLPVRILGSHQPETITDPYMWNAMHCVFERDCLAQGLEGRYFYLDGLTHVEGDPHEKQCFLSWVRHIPTPYTYRFYVAGAYGVARAVDYTRGEIDDFKKSLEGWTKKTITDAALDKAITVYNKNRDLVNKISETRKGTVTGISGADFLEICLAGQLMDKAEHNKLLEQILKDVSDVKEHGHGIRVMLSGGPNDHIDLIREIETMGVQVVADEHDTGGRYYRTNVEPEKDKLHALALRIINKPRSALKDVPNRTRPAELVRLSKEYKAEGVIFMFAVHDDAEQFDYPVNKKALEDAGVPGLLLELDFTTPVEQFRTRIEAFVEMLETKV